MPIYQTIERIMNERQLKVADIARLCGLPDSTVRGIVNRKQGTVALDVAFKLSDGLGVTLQELNDMPVSSNLLQVDFGHGETNIKKAPSQRDEADEVADIYRALDDHGRGAVKAILDFEHAAAIAEQRQMGSGTKKIGTVRKRSDGFIEVKVYDQTAAAGLGNYLDNPNYHMEQYPANVVPDRTDFGIRISGNSMEPDIRDGSTAFVQSRSTIEAGSVGIFLLNGEAFCKRLEVDRYEGKVRLVSINKAYQPREIEEFDDFKTLGLVLGSYPK